MIDDHVLTDLLGTMRADELLDLGWDELGGETLGGEITEEGLPRPTGNERRRELLKLVPQGGLEDQLVGLHEEEEEDRRVPFQSKTLERQEQEVIDSKRGGNQA